MLDRKLERRALLKKAAIGSASLAALYVAPKFTSAGSGPVYATTSVGGCTQGNWKTDTPGSEWPPEVDQNSRYDVVFNVGSFTTGLGAAGNALKVVLGWVGGRGVRSTWHVILLPRT